MLFIGSTQYLASVRSGGAYYSFIVHTGYYVLKRSVAIVAPQLGVKRFIAWRKKYRPYFEFHLLGRLIKVYGIIFTNFFANATFPFFNVKTGFWVYITNKRICLRKVYMDSFTRRYVLIEWVRYIDRTVIGTGSASSAFLLYNVSGLLCQGYFEIPCFPFYTVDFGMGHHLDIGMQADLGQFGREYSCGALIGGESLIELSHMPANGR